MLALPPLWSMRDLAELTGWGQLPVLDIFEEAGSVVCPVKGVRGEAVMCLPRDGGEGFEAAFPVALLRFVTFVGALAVSSMS